MKLKKKLLSLFIPLIITFITLEIGIRAIQFFLLKSKEDQYSQYSKIFSDERDKDYLFFHKPNVNWKLKDGHYDFTFITNKYGHRSLNNNIDFKKSIVFLGDSVIEGASVENDETISYIVEQNLNVPTINLGIASSNTVQEYYLAKEKILPSFNMKLLVLGYSFSDIDQNLYRRYFDAEIGNWPYHDSVILSDNLKSHSFSSIEKKPSLAIKIKKILKNSEAILFSYRIVQMITTLWETEGLQTFNPENWKYTEYFVNKIADYAYENDSDFMVLIIPIRDQIQGKQNFEYQKQFKKLLKKNNIKYLDPSNVLLKFKNQKNPAPILYHDGDHPNKLGTSIIADSISKYIENEFEDFK